MLKHGFDLTVVATMTQLTLEEVKKIKEGSFIKK